MVDWMFVDGSSLIFRAFFGVPTSMRSPDGKPVNAVRGFMERLANLIIDRRPARLAVASDEDWRPPWRVELIPSYKAHRVAEPIPPQLEPQMPIIQEVLDAAGVDFVGVVSYEAEDVIASWTAQAAGQTVEIISGDRDLFALVRGDPSDGLPGLAGVGDKKAAELVCHYEGIEGLLASGRLRESEREYLARARRVVPPVADLPIRLPAGRRDRYPADPERVVTLAERYGLTGPFERLLRALPLLAA